MIDQRAILDLVKINADLGRFGGLIKMWLTTNADIESLSAQGLQRKLENTLSDMRQLQKKMSERLEDLPVTPKAIKGRVGFELSARFSGLVLLLIGLPNN